ncbi:hypothetical protein WDW86_18745 [Bdellovibrionota bacterium FG-2]
MCFKEFFAVIGILFLVLSQPVLASPTIEATQASGNLIMSPSLALKLESATENFVLLQVWTPACDSCAQQFEELNVASDRAAEKGKSLLVLGVPVRGTEVEYLTFLESHRPAFDQWVPDEEFLKQLRVVTEGDKKPYLLLLDRKRHVVKRWRGVVGHKEILGALKG